jgi:hypothetical protein
VCQVYIVGCCCRVSPDGVVVWAMGIGAHRVSEKSVCVIADLTSVEVAPRECCGGYRVRVVIWHVAVGCVAEGSRELPVEVLTRVQQRGAEAHDVVD